MLNDKQNVQKVIVETPRSFREEAGITDAGSWQPDIIEQEKKSSNILAEQKNQDNILGGDLPQAVVVGSGIDPAPLAAEAGGSDSAPPEGQQIAACRDT